MPLPVSIGDDTHLALPLIRQDCNKLSKMKPWSNGRVIRPRNELARRLAVKRNDELLQPGQKAPKFTLPDLNGTECCSGRCPANAMN